MPQQLERFNRIHEAIEQLRALAEVFERRRAALARGAGLTVEQWRALEAIATEHFMPSMFARGRKSSPAAVSKILRQLLEAGLVTVAVASRDLRQRSYALSPRGRRTLDALREARRAAIDAIWIDLPSTEVDAFDRFTRRLIARIESYERRTPGSTKPRTRSRKLGAVAAQ
ncbi:MAG TPA: MarR family transcriptional regulator [Candidatus Binataceae bacterium]|nr:MarR family transcriptional regulator [Candidatus Binataceae bacterium]